MSLLFLDVWLFLQFKVNILHIKNQKKDVFSPFLTICLCCICTCHQSCHLYDSVFYSLCSKVSCQVGIELATLRGAGMGQLSLPSFIKKRNSISISFAALIKGIVTVSYIWLCLLSQREVCVCVCVRDRSVNTRGNLFCNVTNILCITVQWSLTTLIIASSVTDRWPSTVSQSSWFMQRPCMSTWG